MGILIDTVRIANFRAIKNLEVKLSKMTVLVGANNAGKTSFLRAMHLALGIDRKIVNREDVHDDGTNDVFEKEIIIDVRIIPVDANGKRIKEFSPNWADCNGISGNLKADLDDQEFFAFRTKYKFDALIQTFRQETFVLKEWLIFNDWQNTNIEEKGFQKLESIPLIFVDAQRDIQADLKDRSSFLGRMTNKPDIDPSKIAPIESQINQLNADIIAASPNLEKLKEKLKKLNETVLSSGSDGVEISPINKKIKDIGRNLNIHFNDTGAQSFPLEYHGMGTRSWASLLTLNAFIAWQEENNDPYFPILALEEPEAHLHPNAQRQLYHQLSNISGQKIISTHSPFVAVQCDLMDLRHFYKDGVDLKVGQLQFSEPIEKRIGEIKVELENPITPNSQKKGLQKEKERLLLEKRGKINKEEKRKIERNILNSRGEALFSKALVFFEGETEEQALPILAKEKIGRHPFELGINFIGVGGKENYKPFLTLAKFLNIKWYILSDGDGDGDDNTETKVKEQIEESIGSQMFDSLFVLDIYDFEQYVIENGFVDEIITKLNQAENKENYLDDYIQQYHGQPKKNREIRDYKTNTIEGRKDALLDVLHGNKTQFATVIANAIISKKDANGKTIFPPKIDDLFNKIAIDLKIELL